MSWSFSLTLALLAAVGPGDAKVRSGSPSQVELSADRLISEGQHHRLEGHAVLRSEGAVLRADEISYDEAAEEATARGNVMVAVTDRGLYAAVADALSLKLNEGQVTDLFLDHGLLLKKTGVTTDQLLGAETPEALKALGSSSLAFSGTHFTRISAEAWEVDDLVFTPCDCDPAHPSWQLEASHGTLDLEGPHATMSNARVRVHSIPVLWFPWIYLPLSSRKSGLLIPRPGFGQSGFFLEQPVFITLGESHDLTLTPGFYAGGAGRFDRSAPGVQGPRLSSEFRYTPSATTNGRATLGLLYDFLPLRDPVLPAAQLEVPRRRGFRSEGSLQHVQTLGNGWFDRIDASYVSDGFCVVDLVPDVLARENQYLRSTAVLFHRSDDLYEGLDLGFRQDLRWGFSVFNNDFSRVDPAQPLHSPNTLQRLPALTLALPERPLWGPLRGGFRLELTRLAPLTHGTGDEGSAANEGRAQLGPDDVQVLSTECLAERLYQPLPATAAGSCPSFTKEGQGDRLFQPGEREARDRLDFRPQLEATFGLGDFARVSPYLRYRQDFYYGELTGRATQRGYALGGVAVESELSRTFGEGAGSLRHTFIPAVDLRYVPAVLGDAPAPYDEIDTAVPESGRLLQLNAEVRQHLFARAGSSTRELLRLDLGQGVRLSSPTGPAGLADSYARLSAMLGPLTLGGSCRYDSSQRAIRQLAATLGLDTHRGQSAWMSYDNLSLEGSDRTRRGLDVLVGSSAPGFSSDFAEKVSFGARASFKSGIALGYEALMSRTGLPDGRAALVLSQHQLALSYSPACDCWRIEVHALQRRSARADYRDLDVGASLTLAGFGTFGTAH